MISSAIFLLALGIVGADSHGWGMPQGGQYYPHGQSYPHGHNYPHGHGYRHGQDYPQGQHYPHEEYYPQSDVNPQEPQHYTERQPFDPNAEKPRVKFVQGSMDDLRAMDTQWICTNQKSGDTMLIGSMDATGNILTPKPQQPRQPSPWPRETQQSTPRPQEPQQNPWPQPSPVPVPQNPQQSVATSEQPKPAESTRNPGFVEVPSPGFAPKQDPLDSPTPSTRDPLDEFDWAAYIKTANCSVPTPVPSSPPTPVPEFDGTGVIQPRVNN